MAKLNELKQCGSFRDTRKHSPHRIFSSPSTPKAELIGVIDGLDVSFADESLERIDRLNPYDLLVVADGALEACFTDDGDFVFDEVGRGRAEDQ